jgi:hypothetical protein
MKTLRLMTLAICFSFGVAACGGSPVDKFSSLVDKVCACEDKACLDGVKADFDKLKDEFKDYKASDDDKIQGKALRKKMKSCTKDLVKKMLKKSK